jgi:hypothetical protein
MHIKKLFLEFTKGEKTVLIQIMTEDEREGPWRGSSMFF